MKYDDISPVMRRFLGNREGFRKAGFSADDLYLLLAPSAMYFGEMACFCVLRTQGKEFSVICGLVEDQAAFEREYLDVCKRQSEISQEVADRIWEESEVCAKKAEFLLALRSKGIRFSRTAN